MVKTRLAEASWIHTLDLVSNNRFLQLLVVLEEITVVDRDRNEVCEVRLLLLHTPLSGRVLCLLRKLGRSNRLANVR